MSKYCDVCRYVSEDENIERCPACNSPSWSGSELERELKRISSDESFINAMIELKEKDPIEYELKMQQFKLVKKQQKENKQKENNSPKCPTCGSTSISKITSLSKATNVALFGILGTKRKHQFKCNSCKYEW